MNKRLMLSAVVYPMVNAILFGAGAIVVLSFLEAAAASLLPIVTIASFALAAPLSWLIAPRLSLRLANDLGIQRAPAASIINR